MSKNMVERVARRLHGNLFATITDWRDELGTWEGLPDHARNAFMYTARAAIEEMTPATEEMIEAGAIAGVDQIHYKSNAWNRCVDDERKPDHLNYAKHAWRAMLTAALKP